MKSAAGVREKIRSRSAPEISGLATFSDCRKFLQIAEFALSVALDRATTGPPACSRPMFGCGLSRRHRSVGSTLVAPSAAAATVGQKRPWSKRINGKGRADLGTGDAPNRDRS